MYAYSMLGRVCVCSRSLLARIWFPAIQLKNTSACN